MAINGPQGKDRGLAGEADLSLVESEFPNLGWVGRGKAEIEPANEVREHP
jgi:hypothetical protein